MKQFAMDIYDLVDKLDAKLIDRNDPNFFVHFELWWFPIFAFSGASPDYDPRREIIHIQATLWRDYDDNFRQSGTVISPYGVADINDDSHPETVVLVNGLDPADFVHYEKIVALGKKVHPEGTFFASINPMITPEHCCYVSRWLHERPEEDIAPLLGYDGKLNQRWRCPR